MKVRCLFDAMVPTKDLKPHPKNRNAHSGDQVVRLGQILDYQGWRYPIKVSRLSGCITSGHGRLLAAKHMGWKEVPVNYQEYESEEQEYADVQADNAIASWAELDLSAINTDLADLGPDFDIDLLGLRGFLLEPMEKFDPDAHWQDLPEFQGGGESPFRFSVIVHKEEDRERFAKLIGAKESLKRGQHCWSCIWPEK